MKIVLDIPDKVYKEMDDMCKFNDILINDYIFNCALDNFNLMKYDDLNTKMNNEKEKDNIKDVNQTDEVKEKKKVGRPKKIKPEKLEEETKEVQLVDVIPQELEKQRITKRTRTLKVK